MSARSRTRRAMLAAIAVGAILAPALAAPAAQAATITEHAVINEVVTDPLTGSQWVEVHDPTPPGPFGATVCEITDDDGNSTGAGCGNMVDAFLLRIPDPAFIEPGDRLTLHGTAGPIDSVTVPDLGPGYSYARSHDGSTAWEIREPDDVTPNSSNGAVPDDEDPPVLGVSAPAGGAIVTGGFTVSYSAFDENSGVEYVAFYLRDGASTGEYVYRDRDRNDSRLQPFNSIEDVFPLANGIYDLCVTAQDEAGNGSAAAANLAVCDDSLPHVVAIDDIAVTDVPPPVAPDPTVNALAPADGELVPGSGVELSWDRAIDSRITLIRQEVMVAQSADLSMTPVRYRPTGLSLLLSDAILIPGSTWYWQVALVFTRPGSGVEHTVRTPVRSFTVEDDALPPRFEVNGAPFTDYVGARTTVDVCELQVDTFDIGAVTALADVESLGDAASARLVDGQVLNTSHDPSGPAGTWTFRVEDHAEAAIAGVDGYAVRLRIYPSTGAPDYGDAEIVFPLSCIPDDGEGTPGDGGDDGAPGDGDDGGAPGDGDDGDAPGDGDDGDAPGEGGDDGAPGDGDDGGAPDDGGDDGGAPDDGGDDGGAPDDGGDDGGAPDDGGDDGGAPDDGGDDGGAPGDGDDGGNPGDGDDGDGEPGDDGPSGDDGGSPGDDGSTGDDGSSGGDDRAPGDDRNPGDDASPGGAPGSPGADGEDGLAATGGTPGLLAALGLLGVFGGAVLLSRRRFCPKEDPSAAA